MKKIDFSNIESLELFKEELNKAIDNAIVEKRLNEKISTIDDMKFSDLITLFEGVSDIIIDINGGKKLIKEYVSLMKSSKSLRNAFTFNKLIEGDVRTINHELYLNELMGLCHNNNNSEYENDVKRLSNIVKESIELSNITESDINRILENKNKVLDSVDFLFENEKTIKNLTNYVDNETAVIDYLKCKTNLSENINDVSFNSVSEMIDNINENEDLSMDSWKKELIEKVVVSELSNSTKENLFETYKNECMSIFSDISNSDNLSIEFKSKMKIMENNLSVKKFNMDTYAMDISNLAELKNTLIESWEKGL